MNIELCTIVIFSPVLVYIIVRIGSMPVLPFLGISIETNKTHQKEQGE